MPTGKFSTELKATEHKPAGRCPPWWSVPSLWALPQQELQLQVVVAL